MLAMCHCADTVEVIQVDMGGDRIINFGGSSETFKTL